jgi:hypothetical protein
MPGTTDLDSTLPDDGTDLSNEGGTQTPEVPAELLTEATRKGWVPLEEFEGDPKRWVDAKTFIERGERFNKNLQREVQQLKQKLDAFEGTKKQFVKFHEETLASKQRELDTAISALRVQKSQATAEHEHEQAVALEDRIDLLRGQKADLDKEAKALKSDDLAAEPAADIGAQRIAQNAAVEAWVEDGNEWFRDDAKLRQYAVGVTEEMLKDGETARGRKLLDKVTERVKADFPRRFAEGGSTPRSNAVESGSSKPSGAARGAAGKTERDLPPADRSIMQDLVAGGYTTKEKFLASYWSRN